jgi:Peptidase family C25
MAPNDDESNHCVFNGINGATGKYLTPPIELERLVQSTIDPKRLADSEALAHAIAGGAANSKHLKELKARHDSAQPHFGVRPGVDAGKLEEAGWGIVFTHDAEPAIKEALKELTEWRKPQAGEYYYEFEGFKGYRPGDSHLDFLARQRMGPGQADPKKVPYYLLIVGDPEAIPFAFQYQLDVQYAVGRLWFDTPEEYARYARSVVTAEKGQVALPRRAVFFGVRNPDDQATRLSSVQLVEPLGKSLPSLHKKGEPAWEVKTVLAGDATKSRLARLLGGDETPALLFTASHGMGFPSGDPKQFSDQGALLCQDWPGPKTWDRPIPPEYYFASSDVAPDAGLLGLITMHVACYGAGSPRFDDFGHLNWKEPPEIAPRSFLASLPRKLLSHPRGGALAVIGHVDRVWSYSFNSREAGPQLQSFEDTLIELMRGQPVGAALESLNQRYADLSSALSSALQDIRYGKRPDVEGLAGMWTANNDARSYIILGDPAVRLPLASNPATVYRRPVIETMPGAEGQG